MRLISRALKAAIGIEQVIDKDAVYGCADKLAVVKFNPSKIAVSKGAAIKMSGLERGPFSPNFRKVGSLHREFFELAADNFGIKDFKAGFEVVDTVHV